MPCFNTIQDKRSCAPSTNLFGVDVDGLQNLIAVATWFLIVPRRRNINKKYIRSIKKLDSIETGPIIIAHLLPSKHQELLNHYLICKYNFTFFLISFFEKCEHVFKITESIILMIMWRKTHFNNVEGRTGKRKYICRTDKCKCILFARHNLADVMLVDLRNYDLHYCLIVISSCTTSCSIFTANHFSIRPSGRSWNLSLFFWNFCFYFLFTNHFPNIDFYL